MTLRTNLISSVDGQKTVSTEYVARGVAKAFVNFNANVSTTTINNSFNLSSLIDKGAGDYSFSFFHVMENANYVPVFEAQVTSGLYFRFGVKQGATLRPSLASIVATGSISEMTYDMDPQLVYGTFHGDLA